ncbi:putative Protein kinase domain-containing protein [Seiridium unicorne]|uniref:Protein kinase domain-containing protein n=1 Tax=Seiridium unicorne TaxID=138068 RepID=A0ABR2V1F0_9PEZI
MAITRNSRKDGKSSCIAMSSPIMEINEDNRSQPEGITKWSKESDVWGVGAVLNKILALQRPTRRQPDSLEERIRQIRKSTLETPLAVPKLLARIIGECLDPSPDGRPSALQLLSVVTKSDTSQSGLEKGESFWKVMAIHADSELG